MTFLLRIYLIIASVFFLIYVLHMVRRDRFLLRYSFIWVIIAILGVLAALFPKVVEAISSKLGFEAASSFLFVGSILFLMVVSLMLVSALSRQAQLITRLVQEVSILRAERDAESDSEDAPFA